MKIKDVQTKRTRDFRLKMITCWVRVDYLNWVKKNKIDISRLIEKSIDELKRGAEHGN